MRGGAARFDVAQVGGLQERAARAVPATVQELRDGRWLRYVDAPATWWAGATLLHGVAAAQDVAGSVTEAEGFYALHDAPALFQVCPACPPDLDDELTRRGYGWGAEACLQTANATTVSRRMGAPAGHVHLSEQPGPAWLEVLLGAGPASRSAAERRLIHRVDLPSAYATASLDDRAVAVGRAVADTGWAGLFSMVTRPQSRRRGAARAVLSALAAWAAEHGCADLYLQVTRDSRPALGLYAGAGFSRVCRYHYRVESAAASSAFRSHSSSRDT